MKHAPDLWVEFITPGEFCELQKNNEFLDRAHYFKGETLFKNEAGIILTDDDVIEKIFLTSPEYKDRCAR